MQVIQIAQQLYANLISNRKTGKPTISFLEFANLLATIDAINKLPKDAAMFNGRSLENWMVPVQFEPFFVPNSVSLDPTNRLSQDLLVREEDGGGDKDHDVALQNGLAFDGHAYNYEQFQSANDATLAMFRIGDSAVRKPISEIRQDVSLNAAIKRVVYGEFKVADPTPDSKALEVIKDTTHLYYDGENIYWPIRISLQGVMKPGFFNSNMGDLVSEICTLWPRKFLIK